VPGFTLHPTGAFDLARAATFGFGPTQDADLQPRREMALAFCTDDFHGHAGVELRQPEPDGPVAAEVQGSDDLAAVERQVARVLSLDHDGVAWEAVGERDPVIGKLQAEHRGMRPVLFHSPYEAACWGVVSARRPAGQAAKVRDELSAQRGATFTLLGDTLHAFPTPEALLDVTEQPGLPEVKAARLRGIAQAALDGLLDQEALIALEPAEAMERVQRLPGIGPFYATLVVVRATGHADVLPPGEPRTLAGMGHFYGLGRPATPEELEAKAEDWRPYRTWASVLLHAAGRRAGLRPPPRDRARR
jgi:DNA-3-methyladenine glycosylase II